MEELGIVGPFQGSKPRAILVTREQWEQMRSGQSTQMEFEDLISADDTDDESVPEEY
jgi:S-DNA-T family DNA segregation ATPase FtsK/SpoIIIE